MSSGDLATLLLAWYDRNRRSLPWRASPGETPDPYRVWLSEVMLQQTSVAAVIPYFAAFTARWPDVAALAAAPLDDVLAAWAGLGYYARARNLHECARRVAGWREGRFPETEAELGRLPGIGTYTAAAIAAIAFGRPAVVVDGNVLRVMARLFAVPEPLPKAAAELGRLAGLMTPAERPGDYAQAVMDLGATLCTPRNPACGICPWMKDCEARTRGLALQLPARLPKPARPLRHALAFWLVRADGAVLFARRPPEGLLGGMIELPSTPWRDDEPWDTAEAALHAPVPAKEGWHLLPGVISHVFSHFRLDIRVAAGKAGPVNVAGGIWCRPDAMDGLALPSVMRKIARHAQARL